MESSSLVSWLTLLLLALNALFVWMYLQETKKIRIANEAQLEGQIRPALEIDFSEFSLRVVNVGKGPAVKVKFATRTTGNEPDWTLEDGPCFFRDPVAPGTSKPTQIKTGGEAAWLGKCLQIRYESLSGREYASMIDFNDFGIVRQTRFIERRI